MKIEFDKLQAVATLTKLRLQWRIMQETKEQTHQNGFKFGVLLVLELIEKTAPEDELWSHLPDESELTNDSRIGDHLAVTRRLLGFVA